MASYCFYANVTAVSRDKGSEDSLLARISGRSEQGPPSVSTVRQLPNYKISCYVTDGAHALHHSLDANQLDQYLLERSLTNPGDPPSELLKWLEKALSSDSCRLDFEGSSLKHASHAAITSTVQVPGLPRPTSIRLPVNGAECLQHYPEGLAGRENLGIMLELCAREAAVRRENTELRRAVQELQLHRGQQEQAERESKRLKLEEEQQQAHARQRANLRKEPKRLNGAAFGGLTALPSSKQPQQPPSQPCSQPSSQPSFFSSSLPMSQPTLAPSSQLPSAVSSQEELLWITLTSQQQQPPRDQSSQLEGLAKVDKASQQPAQFTATTSRPSLQLLSSQPAAQLPSGALDQGMQQQQQQQNHHLPAAGMTLHAPPTAGAEQRGEVRQQVGRGRGRGRFVPVSGRGRKPLFGPNSG